MEAVQTVEHPTFETVWAALQEVAERQREMQREAAEWQEKMQREAAERQEKMQREAAERQREAAERKKETDREMKEFNRRFGDFTNRFGEVVEYMIAPNLQEKFRELGLTFPQTNSGSYISDYDNNIFLEIDVKLENGDKAMLVEIKTKLTTEDVKEHIERLEKMRKYADLHGDKRVFLGAVAGVVMTLNVKNYALGKGLYVVEPSGETFNITPPPGQPKEF
jgi:chemotaxis protein histidine kinase CheA